jgi:putative ABC transport system permease protein
MIPFNYSIRNLVARKTSALAAMSGLALVVFVFAAVMMMANGIEHASTQSSSPDVAVVLRRGSSAEMESSIDEPKLGAIAASQTIARLPNGRPATAAELVVVVVMEQAEGGLANLVMRGVPDDVLALRPTVHVSDGRAPTPGTDEVIVGRAIASRFKGLAVGKTLEIRRNRAVTIVGVFEDSGSAFESEIWAGLDTAQRLFGRAGYVSSVHVKLQSAAQFDAFKQEIESNPTLDASVIAEPAFNLAQAQGTSTFLLVVGTILALLFSIGAMLGAMVTMHAAVAQRTREIGTLRAVGFRSSSILLAFLLESLVLAGVAGALGASAAMLMRFVNISTLNHQTWSQLVFHFEPSPAIILKAIALAGTMGVLGGFVPALRAARLRPIEAMRGL